MKKAVGIGILFVALMLPVSVFIFLHLFGENRFDIPLYYQNESEIEEFNCQDISTPYQIDWSRIINVELGMNSSTVRVVIQDLGQKEIGYQLARLVERYGDQIQVLVFTPSTADFKEVKTIDINTVELDWRCLFLSKNDRDWILIDNENRVRGYYEPTEEEIDRLLVEIDILLDNTKVNE